MSDPGDDIIERKLREAWRHERRLVHLRGASRVLTCLAILLVAGFLLDWGLVARTEATVRFGLVLSFVYVTALGALLWYDWLRKLRPCDPIRTALTVERRHPELSSLLVTYLQFGNSHELPPNVSAELVAATRRRAVEKSQQIDFRVATAMRELRSPIVLAAGALLLCCSLAIGWNKQAGTFAARLAGANSRYFAPPPSVATKPPPAPLTPSAPVSEQALPSSTTRALCDQLRDVIVKQESLLRSARQLAATPAPERSEATWNRLADEQQNLLGSYGRFFEALVEACNDDAPDRDARRLASTQESLLASQPVIALIGALQHISSRDPVLAAEAQGRAISSLCAAERVLADRGRLRTTGDAASQRAHLEHVPPEFRRHVTHYLEAVAAPRE